MLKIKRQQINEPTVTQDPASLQISVAETFLPAKKVIRIKAKNLKLLVITNM